MSDAPKSEILPFTIKDTKISVHGEPVSLISPPQCITFSGYVSENERKAAAGAEIFPLPFRFDCANVSIQSTNSGVEHAAAAAAAAGIKSSHAACAPPDF